MTEKRPLLSQIFDEMEDFRDTHGRDPRKLVTTRGGAFDLLSESSELRPTLADDFADKGPLVLHGKSVFGVTVEIERNPEKLEDFDDYKIV